MSDDHLLSTGIPSFAMAWKALLLDHRVPDGAVRLYLVLATYTRPDRPVAYPGQETLARQMNCSTDTVQRNGKHLVDTGWIEKVRRGRGRSNLYHLRMPGALVPDVDKPVDEPEEVVPDTADVRLLDTADLRLPYEVELLEVNNPPTPRKRGTSRAPSGRQRDRSPLRPDERPDDFAAWWEEYPRKVGKIAAEQAWRQMIDRLPSLDQLIAASVELGRRTAREHPDAAEWVRYVPHPSTWLRRGDYLDATGSPDRPPTRNPCALCGVPNPCPEVCLGPGLGRIGSIAECVWAERK